jgi:alkylation response protein AidB-like acyl-CoA dehydrogenase
MSSLFETPDFLKLLDELRRVPCADRVTEWPTDHLTAMADAGVMSWSLSKEWGGQEFSQQQNLEGLLHLSSACLVSTFILTQRNGACQRIETSANLQIKQKLLPDLCVGRLFATVGISHLTTSRQHVASPVVAVSRSGDDYVFDGIVPWATGATQADILVTGGQLPDGQQVLAAIPTDREGLNVQPPVELMALNASQTGAVELHSVRVSAEEILHGPVHKVMQQGAGGGAGSLGTSALAVGASGGTILRFQQEADRRPELSEFVEPLRREYEELRDSIRLASAGQHPDGEKAAETVRRRANSLVMRSAQTWLAATKGAGYVAGHPAEQAVRESMFFLVWSCPQPVLAANLRELACAAGTGV